MAQRVPSARLTRAEKVCAQALDLTDAAEMLAAAERLYQTATGAGDARGAACARYAEVYARARLGETGTDRLFADVARAARTAGDAWTEAAATARQGWAAEVGDGDRGIAQIRRGLAIADAAPGAAGREARLVPLNLLAHGLLDSGQPDSAAVVFETLVREARALGSHRFAGIGTYGLGTIAFDRGNMTTAARYYRLAGHEADAEQPALWHTALISGQARIDAATGRLDAAAARLRPLVDRLVATGQAVTAAPLLEQLGGVYRQDPARRGAAVAAYREAHDLLAGTGAARQRFKYRLLEALVLYDAGQTDAARRAARPAADSVAAAPLDPAEEGLAFLMLARDARLGGRPAEAAAFARRSVAAAEASGIKAALVDGTAELALALDTAGDATGALAAYRRSVALSEELRSLDQARRVGQEDADAAFEDERAVEASRRRRLLWTVAALLAVGALAAAGGGLYVRMVRRKNAEIARGAAEIARGAADLERASATRTRFLANVSHELRTPLTLLLGPLDDLRRGRFAVAPEAQPLLDRAAANGVRLRHLIDDLLSLARLDAHALALRRERLDAHAFARARVAAFGSAAERDDITLTATGAPAVVAVDPLHLETVIYNLVSNALAFTPPGGTVRVHVEPRRSGAEITVTDTGVGIAPDDLPHLFDRFFQADTARSRAGEGTGLGLALAREIVALHGGTIAAESTPGVGTTVRIWFPAGTPDAGAGDGAVPEADAPASAPLASARLAGDGLAGDAPVMQDPGDADDRPLVLVVEDNADLRAYLRAILEPTYRVEEAPDGAAGIDCAVETVPDLVLSDVMMPGTDGFALLAALKGDVRTSHVPVVLLTARADAESRLAGLGAGADDYVSKPFSAAEVEARVANLVASRRALRERWSRGATPGAAPSVAPADAPTQEVAFVDGLLAIVEARLADAAFGADSLAEALALSPRQLARKLRALTDQTPAALLRARRLARAAALLQGGMPVGEAADAAGFGSRSGFNVAFRETYGVTPSAFAADPSGNGAADAPALGG